MKVVYCTNPNCQHPENEVPFAHLNDAKGKQRFCGNCGMNLILNNRYLAIKEIGRGGFGKTFKAWDSNLSQDCVIKQLNLVSPSGIPFSPQIFELIQKYFDKEANTLKELKHEQIPRLWDYFDLLTPSQSKSAESTENKQKLFYLVMEYIEGKDLGKLLKEKQRFSSDEVRKILENILPVLKFIHDKGLIHRDIKPANIMLKENTPYLIDFGAVKQAVAGVPAEQSIVIGTIDYAAPEQLAREPVTPASDLYSLAVTCVCGSCVLSVLNMLKNKLELLAGIR
ncbi:MAG: protein kinase domain-containing protein [Gloeotrichia echinulata DVL01]